MNKILKKNMLTITITASLLAIFSYSVMAQPPRGGNPEEMQQGQQGQQGSQTGPDAASILSRMDEDDDGLVTLDDFIAHAVKRTEKDFQRLDSDGDNLISEAEFTTRPGHEQNSSIDHDALTQCIEETTGITLNEPRSAEDEFMSADINSDGYLSYEELIDFNSAQVAERFAELDTDTDGIISEAEITAKMSERQLIDSAHQTCIQEQLLLDNTNTNINPLL